MHNKQNLPDVIIVGAQKCGTTTLHFSLTTHPQVSGPMDIETFEPIKEINFFYSSIRWPKGIDWYRAHFKETNGIFLDSSPNYLCMPSCFGRMQQVVPDAKLIICLRNPTYRAYSQYNHYRQDMPDSMGWDWLYNQNFLENVKSELQKDHGDINSLQDFAGILLRGVYVNQIKQLLKYYDRSQIYISIMDRWGDNYETELNNILNFLNLKKQPLSHNVLHKRNYNMDPFEDEAKQLLNNFYKPFNQQLFDFLGYDIPEWA